MEEPTETIIKVRKELIVSPSSGNPTLRNGHFLRPSTPSSSIKLPSPSFFSTTTSFEPGKSTVNVKFTGCLNPLKNRNTWVDHMHSKHKSTWKRSRMVSIARGVGVGASWTDEVLVGGGSEETVGCVASGFGSAVVVHRLSSFNITTWESICFNSSLDSRLSEPSSPLLLSLPSSLDCVSTTGSSGARTRSVLLKGEYLGNLMALTITIQPFMNPNFQAWKTTGLTEFSASLKPLL
nr:hypothetical protein CFP56_68865 [Quercus suber]